MNQNLIPGLTDKFESLWRFRVTTIDSNDVTIANIVIALIIFITGLLISRKFSRLVIKNVPKSSALTKNSRSLVETVSFYVLLILFTFIALQVAQIPLSSFAVLGGALAIGVGFGSQNVIKNFISGLILMVEQPIRVDDIITVEGTEGKVIKIGARSTHIRTFDNVDILVPNSTLLENNVINWTLSDREVRTRVVVGVEYGTDTKKVDKLLLKAVKKVEEVIKEKPIMIFFTEFGDNSLNFEAQFWCVMPRPSYRRMIESHIRHSINEEFNKAGVVVAFPQRDVHLDVNGTIPVEIVPKASTKKTLAKKNKV